MTNQPVRLFICHASEDKRDFVEPLANALRAAGFDVWYDKFQLTLGANLLQKITEGLSSSDFGVVVLSRAFFNKKKWTENELGGLFALETTSRKIILPIWKDVGAEEIRGYSPILANRVAVQASEGIEKVVDEIRIAVSVAQRKDEIGRENASAKVKALVDTLTERREAERLAYSEQGAQLVSERVTTLFKEVERIITKGAQSSTAIKFEFRRSMQHILYVSTIYGLYLGISVRDFAINSVSRSQLETRVFKRKFLGFPRT